MWLGFVCFQVAALFALVVFWICHLLSERDAQMISKVVLSFSLSLFFFFWKFDCAL